MLENPQGLADTIKGQYPQIVDDFRKSFDILDSLKCDVPLSAHGSFFGLLQKAERVRQGEADAFMDAAECRTLMRGARAGFERELARQRAQP